MRLGDNEEIQDVRVIFIELPEISIDPKPVHKLYTRCATCGKSPFAKSWEAEVWADITNSEHSRHLVRLFPSEPHEGLKEIVAGASSYCKQKSTWKL